MTCGGQVADALERAAVEALFQLPNVSAAIATRTQGFRAAGQPRHPSRHREHPRWPAAAAVQSVAVCCWNPVEITLEIDHEIGDKAG